MSKETLNLGRPDLPAVIRPGMHSYSKCLLNKKSSLLHCILRVMMTLQSALNCLTSAFILEVEIDQLTVHES